MSAPFNKVAELEIRIERLEDTMGTVKEIFEKLTNELEKIKTAQEA